MSLETDITTLWQTIAPSKDCFSTEMLDKESSNITGMTNFLRFPGFQHGFIDHISAHYRHADFKILIAPGSIGAEAYTMAWLADNAGLDNIKIDTLDLSEKFTTVARKGIFIRDAVKGVPELLLNFSPVSGTDLIEIDDRLKNMVRVLPAQDLLTYTPDEPYDAVICLNLFQHLSKIDIDRSFQQKTPIMRYDSDKTVAMAKKLCDLSKDFICANFLTTNGFDTPWSYEMPAPFVEKGFHMTDKNLAILPQEMAEKMDFFTNTYRNSIYVLRREIA